MHVDPPDLAFWPTVRRLAGLWRGEARLVVTGVLAAFVVTGLSVAIPWLIQKVIDDVVVAGHEGRLTPYLAAIAVLAVLRGIFTYVRRYASSRIGVNIEARMRALLYRGYLTFPRAFYDRHATGQVLSRATNDLYPIRYFIGWGVVQTLQSTISIVAFGAVLFFVNWHLALAASVAMPLVGYLTFRFAQLVTPISRRVQQRKADLTEAADESVVGIEMVQAFGREETVRSRFQSRAEAVRDGFLDEARVEARYLPAMSVIPSLAIAVVVLLGGREVIHHQLTLGQFVLFQTLLLQLAWPLESLGWIINLGQRAIASAGRSFAWLEGVDRLPEPAEPTPIPAGPVAVSLRGVRFGYTADRAVLQEIDLDLAPGEIVAVCGSTGSGKSSLLNLLPRFYDPDAGAIVLGGVDLRQAGLADVRDVVGLVTQRPVLFSAPLRVNVCGARPDAPDDEVAAACHAAGVSLFLDDLPDGLDTLIGERGVNLSGGQRQRVALSRALLSRARVLVLDDPLSAVDTVTERMLIERLAPALAGRTVLVASQRLSTIELADRAVVLVDGRIAESGPPAELLRGDGPFAALFADEVIGV